MFLYIDPLKQGLKRFWCIFLWARKFVFIHRSIKTRIETRNNQRDIQRQSLFLYIDPLKQGLKLAGIDSEDAIQQSFYT